MKTKEQIKWAAVQPLTGGMYFGTEKAIGHPAEFILSYSGLDSAKTNKKGEITDSGNEYGLVKYLTEQNRMPLYYNFKTRGLFDEDFDMNPEIVLVNDVIGSHELIEEKPDYSDIDLVVAVPVCAGLSTFTAGTAEARETKNCNMRYLARYILTQIQPKVYIFENAPGLMGVRGNNLRTWFENLANETGYSVAYYKTDTQLHDNVQRRQRTFVYFFKNIDGNTVVPAIEFENLHVDLDEYMQRIPADATQTEFRDFGWEIRTALDYANHLYGENWRESVNGAFGNFIEATHEQRMKFIDFVKNGDYDDKVKELVVSHMQHVEEKIANGLGWWNVFPTFKKNYMPAVMNKTQGTFIHYKEDRLYNVRELLHLMGMPSDYEFQGHVVGKIGQNVPARTAQFIVEQGIKYFTENKFETLIAGCAFFDNINQKRVF